MKISAIIAAAGKGTRMGAQISKQYLILENKPILVHTLTIFDRCPAIDEIILVVGPEETGLCHDIILKPYKYKKNITVVSGGEERQESVYNGLLSTDKDSEIIVIHDGVRPLVTEQLITDSIKGASTYGAAVIAVPVKDTIKISDSKGFVAETPVRRRVWAAQTPQTFKRDIILKAYKEAIRDGFMGTDDCMLVERLGMEVKLIPGSYDNIKITTPHDLILAQGIIRRR